MARTYIPTLIRIMHRTCQYMKRWETPIRSNLTEGQNTLFTAVLVACEALDVALGGIVEEN
jgi:hypothetical protein